MWQCGKRSDKKANTDDVSLRSYVSRKRELINKEKENIPFLHEQIRSLEATKSTLVHRWQFRMQREYGLRIDALKQRIDDIESEKLLKDFDTKVQPYMSENTTQKFNDDSKKKRPMYAPGTSTNNIDDVIETVHSGISKTLLGELMSEMQDAGPKIVIENDNKCPTCCVEMLVQPARATVACQVCGFMASYLDATSTSMSYTDDVEFACFSYKRINHVRLQSTNRILLHLSHDLLMSPVSCTVQRMAPTDTGQGVNGHTATCH